MLEAELAEALQSAASEVLEKMFFIRDADAPEQLPDGAASHDEAIVTAMRFEGNPPGCFALRLTATAARSIAADFLGAEEAELTPAEVREVICELSNMICGSVLSRVESDVCFRLDTPTVIDAAENTEFPVASPGGLTAHHAVRIARGLLRIAIHTEAQACHSVAEYAR